jgi:hypothetical protein
MLLILSLIAAAWEHNKNNAKRKLLNDPFEQKCVSVEKPA